eukprot:m.439375 g.439375  ORF g.439375 m.439375 type:complete len:476 (+) comp56789_c0_seq17:78-1505(+)
MAAKTTPPLSPVDSAIGTSPPAPRPLTRVPRAFMHTALGEVVLAPLPYSQQLFSDGSLGPIPFEVTHPVVERSSFKLVECYATRGNFKYFKAQLHIEPDHSVPVLAFAVPKIAPEIVLHEVEKLAKLGHMLQHENILRIFGASFSESIHVAFFDASSQGTLENVLRETAQDIVTLQKYAMDICSGMVHLETFGFVHWDLAARNIMVHNRTCRIANLGLCKLTGDIAREGFYTNPQGEIVLRWSAPEVGVTDGSMRIRTSKEDSWGFGLLLYEMMTQAQLPYDIKAWKNRTLYLETMYEVQEGLVLPQPEQCPDFIYDIMATCWELQPQNRPNFRTIHRFLTSKHALAELDAVLEQATIARSQPDRTRTKSMSERSLAALGEENAKRREELLKLKEAAAVAQASKDELADISNASSAQQRASRQIPRVPETPRVARKFPNIRDPNGSAKQKRSVSDKAVRRFDEIFSDPAATEGSS